jgi:hypothetical protein
MLRELQHKRTFEMLLLGAFVKLRKVTISFIMPLCPSVRPPTWYNSGPTIRIFMKFYI